MLYEQLLTSLEGDDRSSKMHVIVKKVNETDDDARQRYLKETGRLIQKGQLVVLINTFSKSDCISSEKIDEDTTQESKPLDEVNKQPSYPPPGAFDKPEQREQDQTHEKADSNLKEQEERKTISVPSRNIPISGPNGWMV